MAYHLSCSISKIHGHQFVYVLILERMFSADILSLMIGVFDISACCFRQYIGGSVDRCQDSGLPTSKQGCC